MNRLRPNSPRRPPSSAFRIQLSWLLLGAIVTAGLGQQAFWIVQDRDSLVTRTVYEDAFYYFQTARSMAEGEGSRSSGGIVHNGYHPLWMVICAGFFRAGGMDGSVAPIRMILAFGAILGALTTVMIYAILRRLGCGLPASVFAAACFQLNPFMLSLSTSGLEAPLNALLLAVTVLWLVGTRHGSAEASTPNLAGTILWLVGLGGERIGRLHSLGHRLWRYLVLGVLSGLVYLVRTDNVFFLAGAWLFLGRRVRRDRRAWLGVEASADPWLWLGFSVLVALLVAAPWLLWNLLRFGSIVQGSAMALPLVREIAFFESNPGATAGDLIWFRCQRFAGWFPAILYYTGLGSLWFLLAGVVIAAFFTRAGRREAPRLGLALLELVPIAVAVLCLGFVHKYVRLASREWYYVTSDVLLALVLGVLVHYILTLVPGARTRTAILVAAICLAAGFLGRKTRLDWKERLDRPRAYGLEIVDAMERLPGLTPGEPLGATDSGTVGFFCSRPVINLDGVVNPEAARAIREGALMHYLEEKGIRYLIITPRMANDRIWGKNCRGRLVAFPALTPQGYVLRPGAP